MGIQEDGPQPGKNIKDPNFMQDLQVIKQLQTVTLTSYYAHISMTS